MLAYCFIGLSLVCLVLLIAVGQMGILPALLISLGVFVLLHAIYVVFFWLLSLPIPMDRPLEKRHPFICWGVANGIAVLNVYFGVHPMITGLEKIPTEGRFLYVGNHRSGFDPVIVMDKLRQYEISFISKPSNMKLPLIGRIAYAAGFLAIDRENDRSALRTILTAADYMKRDICSIGIYPEGTRSRTKELLPFHAGSLKAAQKAKVPIVVVCCRGSENIIRNFKRFRRTKVSLDILELIPAETVCAMKTQELCAHIVQIIQQDLDRGREAKTAE